MTNGNQTTITPVDQFIIGAFITVGIGIFAFADKLFNMGYAWAAIMGYAAAGTAYGIYLMESNSSSIHSYVKYLVIVVATTVGYGLTLFANNYINNATIVTDPVLLTGFVIIVVNFAANDLQQYYQYIPDNVVNDITLLIGAILVFVEAIQNAPAGTIFNTTTLLTVGGTALLVYIFQKIPWASSTPTPSPVPAGATPAK